MTELDKLQGTWTVTSLESDGTRIPSSADASGAAITIDGDRFASVGMGDDYTGTIQLFPRKRPKAFDLTFTSGPPEGMQNLGIYTLSENTWTICLATRGDARPTSFATQPDSGIALETLRRGAPLGKPAPSAMSTMTEPAPRITAAVSTEPPTQIEGEWQMVSAVFDGKPLAADMARWCKRITRGNVTQIFAGHQTMLDATFSLDPSPTPRCIDYVNRSGANKDKAQSGIYELSGDTLRVCMAPPGGKRRDDFASTKGDGRSFTVWRLPER